MEKKVSLKAAQKANASKASKTKKSRTDEKTAKVIKDRVKKEKEPKYIYPDDVEDKKQFRAGVRRQLDAWRKRLAEQKDAEKKAKLTRKAARWAQETYTKSNIPTFE